MTLFGGTETKGDGDLPTYKESQAATDSLIEESKKSAGAVPAPPVAPGPAKRASSFAGFAYPDAFKTEPHDCGAMEKDYQNNVIGIKMESIEPHDPEDGDGHPGQAGRYRIRFQLTFSAQRRRFARAYFEVSLILPAEATGPAARILGYAPVKQAYHPLSAPEGSSVTWNSGWTLEPNVSAMNSSVQLGSVQGGRSGTATGEYTVVGTAATSSRVQWNVREGSHAKAGIGSHIVLDVFTNVDSGFGVKCKLEGRLSSFDNLYLKEKWMIDKTDDGQKYLLTQVSQIKK